MVEPFYTGYYMKRLAYYGITLDKFDRVFPYMVQTDYYDFDEMVYWCEDNCWDEYRPLTYQEWLFKDSNDAMRFKLVFG